MTTLLQRLDCIPPFLCFALARQHGKRPGYVALAEKAGIPIRTFLRIARKLSWSDVKVGQIEKFSAACGVDLMRQEKQLRYLRDTVSSDAAFAHLNPQQRRTLQAQLVRFKALKALQQQARQNQSVAGNYRLQ